jgi:hypothetical protein
LEQIAHRQAARCANPICAFGSGVEGLDSWTGKYFWRLREAAVSRREPMIVYWTIERQAYGSIALANSFKNLN